MKTIVVTGASAGIGAAIARRLGRDGNQLVLAARRAEALRDVAKDCDGGAITVVADVTRRADVERIRGEALNAYGAIDVWINNAGRGDDAADGGGGRRRRGRAERASARGDLHEPGEPGDGPAVARRTRRAVMHPSSPQAPQMADESMVRNLAAQAEAIWPQEQAIV